MHKESQYQSLKTDCNAPAIRIHSTRRLCVTGAALEDLCENDTGEDIPGAVSSLGRRTTTKVQKVLFNHIRIQTMTQPQSYASHHCLPRNIVQSASSYGLWSTAFF